MMQEFKDSSGRQSIKLNNPVIVHQENWTKAELDVAISLAISRGKTTVFTFTKQHSLVGYVNTSKHDKYGVPEYGYFPYALIKRS